uniref:Uncharacterized protein n=1 Tax=Panagrolaimus superbus TaxID=310955 RepID=A0A914Y597_9BILA
MDDGIIVFKNAPAIRDDLKDELKFQLDVIEGVNGSDEAYKVYVIEAKKTNAAKILVQLKESKNSYIADKEKDVKVKGEILDFNKLTNAALDRFFKMRFVLGKRRLDLVVDIMNQNAPHENQSRKRPALPTVAEENDEESVEDVPTPPPPSKKPKASSKVRDVKEKAQMEPPKKKSVQKKEKWAECKFKNCLLGKGNVPGEPGAWFLVDTVVFYRVRKGGHFFCTDHESV